MYHSFLYQLRFDELAKKYCFLYTSDDWRKEQVTNRQQYFGEKVQYFAGIYK